IQNPLGLIPTCSAENFEIASDEPPVRRRSVQSAKIPLALRTPRIRTCGVGVVAPEESDILARVDRVGDMSASQPDSLLTVTRALCSFGHGEPPPANVPAFSCERQEEAEGRPAALVCTALSAGPRNWLDLQCPLKPPHQVRAHIRGHPLPTVVLVVPGKH